jgi:putative photosynthetic complex assembly protein 2
MRPFAAPALFVLAAWWLGTAVVLLMVWLRRSTYRLSLAAVSATAAVGLVGLFFTREAVTPMGAYLAFLCALAIWAWHELTFLLGVVTGPRKQPSPNGVSGLRRFLLATATVIHHEVALAATLALVVALTWNQPNQVGTQTFLVLWVMRLSSKFNLFLGVRNVAEEFIPDHLRYLTSYFRKAKLNPLMPLSIAAATTATVMLARAALAPSADEFLRVGSTLVGTLLALAIIEHLFLALPVPDAMLWRWAVKLARRSEAPRGPDGQQPLILVPEPVAARTRA